MNAAKEEYYQQNQGQSSGQVYDLQKETIAKQICYEFFEETQRLESSISALCYHQLIFFTIFCTIYRGLVLQILQKQSLP